MTLLLYTNMAKILWTTVSCLPTIMNNSLQIFWKLSDCSQSKSDWLFGDRSPSLDDLCNRGGSTVVASGGVCHPKNRSANSIETALFLVASSNQSLWFHQSTFWINTMGISNFNKGAWFLNFGNGKTVRVIKPINHEQKFSRFFKCFVNLSTVWLLLIKRVWNKIRVVFLTDPPHVL